MREISSMDRLMTVAKSSASAAKKTPEVDNSFDKIMADTAASSEASKKAPDDKKTDEEKTENPVNPKEEKEQKSVQAEQLAVTDISQLIPVADGAVENLLKSDAERAAVLMVTVQSKEAVAEPSALQTAFPEQATTKTAETAPEPMSAALPEKAGEISEHLQSEDSVVQLQGQKTPNSEAVEQKETVLNQPKQETTAAQPKTQDNAAAHAQEKAASATPPRSGQEEGSLKTQATVPAQTEEAEQSTPVVLQTQEKTGENDTGRAQSGQSEVRIEEKTENPVAELADEAVITKQTVNSEPETVKVKVAEPYRNLDAEATKQLAGKITEGAQQGKKEMVIQLDPEHLGKISIKISVAEEGVKVILGCENQRTLNLLSDKAAGINQIVESNLNQHAVVEIKEDGYWNQQKNATDQQRQNSRQNEEPNDNRNKEETDDFIQQLRLGMHSEELAI